MKKTNKKGFTLAELLIVVAIIAVLVAIAIPVFTTQLEKSREATDLANIRSAYASLVTQFLEDGKANSIDVPVQQKQANWQNNAGYIEVMVQGSVIQSAITAETSGNYTVAITTEGVISIT